MAKGESHRGARIALGVSHGKQHVARLCDPGRASRTSRTIDPGEVQQHQDRISRASREPDVGDARKAISFEGWPVHYCSWHGGKHRVDQAGTQFSYPPLFLNPMLRGDLDSGSKARDSRNVQSA
jgi:hypothetical protein